MDGDPITPESQFRSLAAMACSRGLTGTQVLTAIHEVELLAASEGVAHPAGKLDGASFAHGAAYVLLWLTGIREQTPTAYLASARESGSVR